MGYIDLHVHSTASDGSLSPSELVFHACEKGLTAFALTDHDSVDGIALAKQAASDLPLTIIPGVEISSVSGNMNIHMLGYFMDYKSPELLLGLSIIRGFRDERNSKICAQLRAYGVSIDYERLQDFCGCRCITRNHIAQYLIHYGYVATKLEAFDRFLAKGRPCYIPEEKISTVDAIRLILRAGGLPIMAHPCQLRLTKDGYRQVFSLLKSSGLAGIEAIYSKQSLEEEQMFRELAKELDLIITGGSDFHGSLKPDIDLGTGYGNLMIPDTLLTTLRNTHKTFLS